MDKQNTKYWVKKEVKDPYGRNWRFLFGKHVWSRFEVDSADGFTLIDGMDYIGYKKRYSVKRLCYVYEYLFKDYESALFDYERGLPPIKMNIFKPL